MHRLLYPKHRDFGIWIIGFLVLFSIAFIVAIAIIIAIPLKEEAEQSCQRGCLVHPLFFIPKTLDPAPLKKTEEPKVQG